MTLSRVVEALLFSAQKPLSIRELAAAIKGAGAEDELSPNEFARATEREIAAAIEQLKIEYIQEHRAFQIIEKAEGWQLCPVGAQAFSCAQAGAPDRTRARDTLDYCLPSADHARRR